MQRARVELEEPGRGQDPSSGRGRAGRPGQPGSTRWPSASGFHGKRGADGSACQPRPSGSTPAEAGQPGPLVLRRRSGKLLDDYAWTKNNSGGSVFHSVGIRKRPNAFGLFDMHGNAWEWCADEFAPLHRRDGRRPPGAASREKGPGVVRGGSFDWDKVERTRSAYRHSYLPHMSYYGYGFRVCSPAH